MIASQVKRGAIAPRYIRPKDKAYMAYVTTYQEENPEGPWGVCQGCGVRGVKLDPAHTGKNPGRGLKTSDYSCIPLCRKCHDDYHARVNSEDEWFKEHGIEIELLKEKLLEGWL